MLMTISLLNIFFYCYVAAFAQRQLVKLSQRVKTRGMTQKYRLSSVEQISCLVSSKSFFINRATNIYLGLQ